MGTAHQSSSTKSIVRWCPQLVLKIAGPCVNEHVRVTVGQRPRRGALFLWEGSKVAHLIHGHSWRRLCRWLVWGRLTFPIWSMPAAAQLFRWIHITQTIKARGAFEIHDIVSNLFARIHPFQSNKCRDPGVTMPNCGLARDSIQYAWGVSEGM